MIPLREVPLFGSGIAGKSYVVTRQRRLNVYFEIREDADKTKVAVYGTPGLVADLLTSTPAGLPVRGMLGTQNSLYLVGYNQFQAIKPSGSTVISGTVQSTSGACSLANNATQVVIADGTAGYL